MNGMRTALSSPRVLILLGFLIATGCGQFGLGGSALSPNDPVPSGTAIGSKSFSTASGVSNGSSASGTVTVYYQSTGPSFVVRLSNLNISTTSVGLRLDIYNSGSTEVKRYSLRSYTGNQNYTITGLGTNTRISWTVQIVDPNQSATSGNYVLAEVGIEPNI